MQKVAWIRQESRHQIRCRRVQGDKGRVGRTKCRIGSWRTPEIDITGRSDGLCQHGQFWSGQDDFGNGLRRLGFDDRMTMRRAQEQGQRQDERREGRQQGAHHGSLSKTEAASSIKCVLMNQSFQFDRRFWESQRFGIMREWRFGKVRYFVHVQYVVCTVCITFTLQISHSQPRSQKFVDPFGYDSFFPLFLHIILADTTAHKHDSSRTDSEHLTFGRLCTCASRYVCLAR